MAKSFDTLRESMSPASQRKADQQARRMMADMLLAEVRKEAGMTQNELAKEMGIRQPSLSKLESQTDMRIETLQKLIHALGGELEIIAHMPTGDFRIRQFAANE